MDFSALHSILSYTFRQDGNTEYPESSNAPISYDCNNIYKAFLEVNLEGDELEIPAGYHRIITKAIANNIEHSHSGSFKNDKMVIALYESAPYTIRKTFNSIMNTFHTARRARLVKVNTSKGETYYIGNGFILDKDYNILLLFLLHAIKKGNEYNYDTGRVYIHPSIFTNTGILEKGIIKYLIPTLTVTSVNIVSRWTIFQRDINFSNRSEIIIKDVTSKFIVKPKKPNLATFNNEDINNYLINNLDNLQSLGNSII